MRQHLTKVDLTAFQHSQNLPTASLGHLDVHVRIVLREAVQELRKHAFDVQQRGAHFQHADVATSQLLRSLAELGGVGQQTAAIAEQLLAFTGQTQAAPDTIEQFEAELLLKARELPGIGQVARFAGAGPPSRRCLAWRR